MLKKLKYIFSTKNKVLTYDEIASMSVYYLYYYPILNNQTISSLDIYYFLRSNFTYLSIDDVVSITNLIENLEMDLEK